MYLCEQFPKNMKLHKPYYILVFTCLLLLASCSTKRNTPLSRNYHALNTRFNVLFNANESFKEGLALMEKNHREDYSRPLPLFIISHHENAQHAKNNMAFTIVKTNKAVKAHSIRVKPARGKGSAEYRNRPEFNPMIDDVWLLMGKAHFYSGDFLSAQLAFAFAARQFSWDKEYLAETQLWTARCFIEMGWLYEAEDLFTRLNQSNLPQRLSALYAAVNADLLIRKGKQTESLPFLQIAAKNERNNRQQARTYFVMAQIYEQNNERKHAFEAYEKATKGASFEMNFNARIRQTEMYTGNKPEQQVKKLRSMARGSKYSDYLDQIYLAIGNVYLRSGNEKKAIESYRLGIEKSTRKGFELGVVMATLADLYFDKEEFVKAEPLYTEAARLISNEHEKFPVIKHRSEVLGELTTQLKIVQLQDSLQALSLLSEEEQMKMVKAIIKKKKEDEEAARKDSIKQTQPTYFNPLLTTQSSNSFYFYNPSLVENGKNEFNRRWGRRTLEDDWARAAKSAVAFDDMPLVAEEETAESAETDTSADGTVAEPVIDAYSPEFYLRQIPRTPEQIEQSNTQIADALYKSGIIYKDKLGNNRLAIKAFEELASRFPYDTRIADMYFYAFQMFSRANDTEQAEVYRLKLIENFPESTYAQLLAQPDYVARIQRMAQVQDSIYQQTYTAYTGNRFEKVKTDYAYMQTNYATSDLLPKFALLNALSIGKSESAENFKAALNDLMVKYPDTDISAMAKDLLALVEQGKIAQIGDAHGSLLARRNEEAEQAILEAEAENTVRAYFEVDKNERHFFIINVPKNYRNINKLVYDVASYNFARFLTNDYDIDKQPFSQTIDFLVVRSFDNLPTAIGYMNDIVADEMVSKEIDDYEMGYFIISEENFKLLLKQKNFAIYQPFFQRYIYSQGTYDIINAPIFGVGEAARKVYQPRKILVR